MRFVRETPSLPVLYQDKHLVVINKPSGLLVHRSEIDRHETQNAMTMLRDQLGQWVYPVHRLDKPTSGALIFALDQETAKLLAKSFQEHQLTKSYLAVVRGYTEELGEINHHLQEYWDKMTDKKANRDKPAQSAITRYQRLDCTELPYFTSRYPTSRYSLLQVTPLTGRMHQIRRHFKHIFHPLVGDTTHGDGKHNTLFREQFDCHRLLLHAYCIDFHHPYSKELIQIFAPLDTVFKRVLQETQLVFNPQEKMEV